MANASGLSVRALRHYDELGVLHPSARSEAGYRLYDDSDVRRLYRVIALRQLGFPLQEIISLLENDGPDLAETARRHLRRVEQDLELQQRVRRQLAPMVEALDRCEQPSVDDFLAATEVASMDLKEDQWSELFHPDTLYFDEHALEGERSDRDVELQVRLLGLTERGDVLDAPCGWGRHANRLAARGFRVVGFDNDPYVLQHAREGATAIGVDVEYLQGDLRELPFEARFDAIVNWRSSFGFFDDDGNHRQLREFARVLRPGGRLAMDLHNRDDVLRRMPARGPLINIAERDDDFLIERVHLDQAAERTETERIVIRDGRVRRFRFSLAAPSTTQLCRWLHEAGFADIAVYGGAGGPFGSDSRRVVLVARLTAC